MIIKKANTNQQSQAGKQNTMSPNLNNYNGFDWTTEYLELGKCSNNKGLGW
jgi:hypothetical protein